MKNRRRTFLVWIVFLSIAVIGTGCSSTGGLVGHGIMTEVQLGQPNFEIVKSVTGVAQADYFFGIGPSDQDLLGRAKRDMISRAKLEGSQAIVNVTTDIEVTWFLIWFQKKAYVSGEVVQFK